MEFTAFILYLKNDIFSIFMSIICKISNFANLDIGEKSEIWSYKINFLLKSVIL